jgi:hypothetical protein
MANKKRLESKLASRAANDEAARGADDGPALKKNKFEGPLDRIFSRVSKSDCDNSHAALQFAHPTVPAVFFSSPDFKDYIKTVRNSDPSWKPPDRQKVLGPMLDEKFVVVKKALNKRAEQASIFGMTVASDAATVMGEPLVNVVGAIPLQSKPLALGILNCSRHLADGGHKDGLYYAEVIVEAIDALPDAGRHTTLVVTDTPKDMQRAWRLLKELRPFLFTAPCVSHCCNVLLHLVAKIPDVQSMFEEALKFNEQWTGPHHQRTLLKKHTIAHFERELSALRSCDSRFGINFLVIAKLLVIQPALKSVVCDPMWDAKLGDDIDAKIAKELVMDSMWWSNTKKIMYAVWPMVKLVKLGGFQKPSMSLLYKFMKDAESRWAKLAADEDFKYSNVAQEVLQIIESNVVETEESEESDPENRWNLMKSAMALAAYVLDPRWHGLKPWTDPEAMAAFREVSEKILGIDRTTGEYEDDLMNERMPLLMEQFSRYQAKLGQLSKEYVWSNLDSIHACSWYGDL